MFVPIELAKLIEENQRAVVDSPAGPIRSLDAAANAWAEAGRSARDLLDALLPGAKAVSSLLSLLSATLLKQQMEKSQ